MFFIKFMGFSAIGSAFVVWWFMLEGLWTGRIEFTTKGSIGESWYSRIDSPNAFWIVIGLHFLFGVLFLSIAYFILRNDQPRASLD
ncbi:hypothetical protein [Massilia sp. MS-15]|uniref:hypothetical protein n=1 Tax=Massilia sp. MS-15 TaxID=2878200 RepID=UPI001CD690D0|nr:hypothetical protein [Massilia sp. MS-15]MCA1246711.1 hypothetical protein [Massilia sp. MS-15]